MPIILGMFINGKEFLTVEEMAERLGKNKPAIRQLLHNKGHKPVSKDALYAVEAFDEIKNIPPWGWPKGKARKAKEEPENKPEPEPPVKPAGKGRKPKK